MNRKSVAEAMVSLANDLYLVDLKVDQKADALAFVYGGAPYRVKYAAGEAVIERQIASRIGGVPQWETALAARSPQQLLRAFRECWV